ncbi:hypothetical protein BG004_006838, partial [Podila humilis]
RSRYILESPKKSMAQLEPDGSGLPWSTGHINPFRAVFFFCEDGDLAGAKQIKTKNDSDPGLN